MKLLAIEVVRPTGVDSWVIRLPSGREVTIGPADHAAVLTVTRADVDGAIEAAWCDDGDAEDGATFDQALAGQGVMELFAPGGA